MGSVALDTIETPAGRRDRILGGSATYFAAAARLSTTVSLVSAVGDDFREEDEAALRVLGIDTTALERLPGRTYAWHGSYGEDYANATTIRRDVGVSHNYTPPETVGHRGGGLFLGSIDPLIQRRVLSASPDMALTAVDSREAWIHASRADILDLVTRVGAVFLNTFELAALTGEDSAEQGALSLLASGACCVIVKQGAAGASLHKDGLVLSVPACESNVVDPTGAGDAFAGGFLGTLATRRRTDAVGLGSALCVGAATAAFTLESFGIESLATLKRDEVSQRAGSIEWHAPQ